MRRLVLATATALVLLVAMAAPAAAHAELLETDPGASATVTDAPPQLKLTFSEPVTMSPGAVRMFDDAGKRGATPQAKHEKGDPSTITVDLPDLADGTYAVTWRVVSEDSHPIHGAYTFNVGNAGATSSAAALAKRLASADAGDRTVGVVFGLVRFLAFVALATAVGALVFLGFVWPEGWSDRRARRIVAASLAVTAVTAVLSIGLQGTYAAGLGLSSAIDPTVWGDVPSTRFGATALVRLVLAVAGFAFLLRRAPRALVIVAGLLLAATLGFSGHAATGSLAAVTSVVDSLHVAAVGTWLGGLAVLLFVVLRRDRAGSEGDVAPVASRFSQLALIAVGVIVLTGLIQSWRQVGTFAALFTTTYGRLLLTKLGVFLALLGFAWVSRAWVQQHRLHVEGGVPGVGGNHSGPSLTALRRSVGGEAVLAVVVLAVTSVLVNTVPARVAVARSASVEFHTDELLIEGTVDPAKRGPADVHIYTLGHDGSVADVLDVEATFTLASPPIGPLTVPLHKAGPGHYTASGFELPLPGAWDLEVTATINDISQTTGSATVDVR